MTQNASLRTRLTAIILLPLLALALIAGFWQLKNAQNTAREIFDRALLSSALAVVNDVGLSDGDALSPTTLDLLSDTSGGQVFYHVYAPDGVIVAGYATPPVGLPGRLDDTSGPAYFDAIYQGRDVRVVRLHTRMQIDGFSGIFTTTVWQDRSVRTAFIRDLVMRSVITISGLVASLALTVWFGVRFGLRPLADLEDAIGQRSSDELTPIKRAVPSEVSGIVDTLNRLFAQVSRSMTAQAEFISNAAHQLRNPISGVLSLAEAVHAAPDPEEAHRRSADLLAAARETADLSQKLLLLERAKAISPSSAHEDTDIDALLAGTIEEIRATAPRQVQIDIDASQRLGEVRCDPTMIKEAIRNLVDNALQHGGPGLDMIQCTGSRSGGKVSITVVDNGMGVQAKDLERARERFQQVSATSRSGLGLSIVDAIAAGHGGSLKLERGEPGLIARISFPVFY